MRSCHDKCEVVNSVVWLAGPECDQFSTRDVMSRWLALIKLRRMEGEGGGD